jgi:tetratricopeptide (TPR) repeat protein
VALAAALIVGAGLLHAGFRARLVRGPSEELLYYPSGFMAKQASLGYETAAADLAWLRAIQYYGEHRMTDQKYDRIGQLMRIVTELDPHFIQPYVFGAFVTAQEVRQPERGLDLLERGLRANPDNWELAFKIGFLHYVCTHDYAAAARYFTWAARMPGHAEYVTRFAAFANQRSGNTEVAILLWKEILANGNKYMQDVARRELRRLEAL